MWIHDIYVASRSALNTTHNRILYIYASIRILSIYYYIVFCVFGNYVYIIIQIWFSFHFWSIMRQIPAQFTQASPRGGWLHESTVGHSIVPNLLFFFILFTFQRYISIGILKTHSPVIIISLR